MRRVHEFVASTQWYRITSLRSEMKWHRKVGKEVVEYGEGRSPPLVPQTVICYVQAFAAVHREPSNIPLFPVYLSGKANRISGPWPCVAQLMLEGAANGDELPLLPTPPLFSFPSSNAFFISQRS